MANLPVVNETWLSAVSSLKTYLHVSSCILCPRVSGFVIILGRSGCFRVFNVLRIPVRHSKTSDALNSVMYGVLEFFHSQRHLDILNNIDRTNHCLIHFCSLILPQNLSTCFCIPIQLVISHRCFALMWRVVIPPPLINDEYGYWWKNKLISKWNVLQGLDKWQSEKYFLCLLIYVCVIHGDTVFVSGVTECAASNANWVLTVVNSEVSVKYLIFLWWLTWQPEVFCHAPPKLLNLGSMLLNAAAAKDG